LASDRRRLFASGVRYGAGGSIKQASFKNDEAEAVAGSGERHLGRNPEMARPIGFSAPWGLFRRILLNHARPVP